jgi:RND family efflux transporter MFP subunit
MLVSGRYSIVAAALVAGLMSNACLPILSLPGQTTAASSSTQAADGTTAARSGIRLAKAIRGDVTGVATFAAPIQAKGSVAVIPRVNATLTKLDVDVGSRVRAGDTVAELDHTELDEQVQAAEAAQATAEAKLAELKAGPKAEALAAAQANYNAAAARVKALQSARDNVDLPSLDQRVKDARAALDKAQAALQPDPQAVAQADAAAQAAQAKLAQLQADPAKSKDQAAVDAAKADVQKANDAATKARTPSGTQAAVTQAQNELNDAQQAQLIARLSSTAFDLDQAKSLMDAADAQLQLVKAPASPEELQAAQAAVDQAFALAELARARARDATITAPISGIVAEITAALGANVGPGASIMTLIPPDMQVMVEANQDQLAQVQVGQSVSLSVESFPREAFNGVVRAIAPMLDPRTHTAAVQVDIPDPQSKLKPGMFAQLAIQLGQHQSTLLVPKEAVLKLGSIDPTAPLQNVVFTVANGRVHKQVVTLGISDGKNTEILDGVQEGVDVVLNPRPDFLEGELIAAT